MRITGTKKLLIILLALICAAAAVVAGILFAPSIVNRADASSQDIEKDEAIAAVADKTGIDYELVNFYAHANGVSADALYNAYEEFGDKLVEEMADFLGAYAAGEMHYTSDEPIEDEDWFISPDEASTYASNYLGYQSIWTGRITGKPISKETELWGSPEYVIGENTRWGAHKNNLNYDEAFLYVWVWLEPGEDFNFGIRSAITYNSVGLIAQPADYVFDYMRGKQPYCNSSWFMPDADGVYRGSDPQKKTLEQYKQDYHTDIAPSTSHVSWKSYTTGAGEISINIHGDAPSGVYGVWFYYPERNGNSFFNGSGLSSYGQSTAVSNFIDGVWPNNIVWSRYTAFKVIVCRSNVSQPVMKFDNGVNAERTKREVTYNGEEQTMSFDGDYGPGLMSYKLYQWSEDNGKWYRFDDINNIWYEQAGTTIGTDAYQWKAATKQWLEYDTATNKWIVSDNHDATEPPGTKPDIRLVSRTASGGAQVPLTFGAKECGKYKVSFTPFNLWTNDGTNRVIVCDFIINKIKLQRPSLINEAGVTGNTKFVNDNEQDQFISLSPYLTKYMNLDMGGLKQYSLSSDGLLTLTGSQQNTYTIKISLKNDTNTNIEWATPNNGDVLDTMEFEFTIGPMKIITPYLMIEGGVNGNTKEVTYTGQDILLSIMFWNVARMEYSSDMKDPKLDANGIIFSAKESGTYEAVITPFDRYCWDDGTYSGSTDPLVFKLIINKQKISAPVVEDPEVIDGVKTVTYYGEFGDDGNEWITTIRFSNAYEAKVSFNQGFSDSMNRRYWYDSELILSGHDAGEYHVYFTCNDNYMWDDGVDTPYVTLIIKPKPIALPYMIEDDDDDGEFKQFINGNQKNVNFDFNYHTFHLWAGTPGSVTISYNTFLLDRRWNYDDPNLVTFTGSEANSYPINVTPTANYCWSGTGTNESKSFIFRIAPISLPPLPMFVKQVYSTGEEWLDVPNIKTGVNMDYDGESKYVKIGVPGVEMQEYDKNKWHFYQIADASGKLITDFAAHGITVVEGNGYLEFSAVNAGTYLIKIGLQNSNYTWDIADELDGTIVSYRLVINSYGIKAPVIDRTHCEGNQLDVEAYDVYGVYYNQDFTLSVELSIEFEPFITVKCTEGMTYAGWTVSDGKSLLTFKARVSGVHSATLLVTHPNYKWASGQESYKFNINIAYAPVSGLEFWYVDADDGDTVIGLGDYRNGATASKEITFSEGDEIIFFNRTTVDGLIPTGFIEQYEYTITPYSLDPNYVVEMTEEAFDNEELRLSAFDAGIYVVTITPRKDYCWKDSQESKESVVFTLKINKLGVVAPKIFDDGGEIVNGSTKKIEFTGSEIPLTLNLYNHPDAYTAYSWVEDGSDVQTALMVDPVTDKEKSQLIAKATSKGYYRLIIILSNTNNYEWHDPESPNMGESCTFYLDITGKGITLPKAFLTDAGTEYKDATRGTEFDGLAQASVGYDGNEHLVYILGETVKGGAFSISYKPSKSSASVPLEISVDPSGDKYYVFSAVNADTYVITVKFITNDYFWTDNSGTEDRTFTLTIATKRVNVPVFKGYESQPLSDNSHFAYFEYSAQNENIDIINCDFGKDHRFMTVQSYTGANGFEYTGFKLPVDSDTGTTVAWENAKQINMYTIGCPDSSDYASAAIVYCLEFNIDKDNAVWSTGDTEHKLFYIVIQKKKVEVPAISSSTILMDQFSKSVVYTGDDWTDALVIKGLDPTFIGYTLALPGEMTGVFDASADKGTLTVSCLAPAKTYTVIVSLLDPDNMEWKDTGSIENLNFSLIVGRKSVALPVVQVISNAGQEGVIGTTKTVTYNYEEQYIQIGGYWADDRWMSLEVTSTDTFDYELYESNKFPYDPNNADDVKYHDINKGLLTYGATNAGVYTVTFTLSGNSVWADGSDAPVSVNFIINKKQYDTPYILGDGTGIISGFNKTFTYELDDTTGKGKPHDMKIMNYNYELAPDGSDIMSLVSPIVYTGTASELDTIDQGADTTEHSYAFKATNAGVYEITFELADFDNTRWKYADKATITFKFIINKLSVPNPLAVNTYLLDNESLNGNTLTVDYDNRQHSLMLENIIKTGNVAGDTYSYYIAYDNTTDSSEQSKMYVKWEASVSASVQTVYGSTYDGTKKDWNVVKDNVLMFGATLPGTYSLKLSIYDKNNMIWADGSDEQDFVLVINTMKHEAPRLAQGTSATQEYNGSDGVEFKIRNVYNGKLTEDGPVVGYPYEKYKITYTDRDGNDTVYENTATAVNDLQASWFDGVLTLNCVKVGKYEVEVWINEDVKEFVEWSSGTSPWKQVFTVTERKLTTEVTFKSTDGPTDASLKLGLDQWPISSPVTADVKISNFVVDKSINAVDQNVRLKIYFVKNGDTTQKILRNEVTVLITNGYIPNSNNDGTYYILIENLVIPSGQGNIDKAVYSIYVEQCYDASVTQTNCNYVISDNERSFEIVADKAPFKESLLQWQCAVSTDPTNFQNIDTTNAGASSDRPVELPYLTDGSYYIFSVTLNAEGWRGFQYTPVYGDFDDGLKSWWVKQDGVLSGDVTQMNANSYSVRINISAYDSNQYSFATTPFTLYYRITPAKYNLSVLRWDYDGSTPFVFDGDPHSVNIVGTLPNGLAIAGYKTVSAYAADNANTNSQIYGGTYTTTVIFSVNTTNYLVPTSDNSTYTGTFEWTVTWKIEKKKIEVEWVDGDRDSNGTVISYYPQIAGEHANKFYYEYLRWDETANGGAGDWVTAAAIERPVGGDAKYLITPKLRSTPNNPSTDYVRSYEFEVIGGENPLEYTVGGNDTAIVNHIEINGLTDTQYVYTGNPVDIKVIIDADLSGGAITEANIIVNVYSKVNTNRPLSSAPYEIGEYVVKLALSYSGTSEDFYLTMTEFEFEITKASFDLSLFEWRYTHTDEDGNEIHAVWDEGQKAFIDTETKKAVKVEYDGRGHRVDLYYPDSSILEINTSGATQTEAGDVTSKAFFTFDTDLYNTPGDFELDWTIEQKFLDLSLVKWNYEQPYEYTLVNGKAKEFEVEVLNVPKELNEYVNYVTTYYAGTLNEKSPTRKGSQAGPYLTVFTVGGWDDNEFFVRNFKVGELPSKDVFNNELSWKIVAKEIDVPANLTQIVFDGALHNVLNEVGLATAYVDWEEYVTVKIEYTSTDAAATPAAYDGTKAYGNKYFVYNAGTYTLTLSLKAGFNTSDTTNLVFATGSGTDTADQTVAFEIEKMQLVVEGWIEKNEASTVKLAQNVSASKYLDYEFHAGSDDPTGAVKTLNDVLEALEGTPFTIVAIVKKDYEGNIDIAYSQTGKGYEFVSFTAPSLTDRKAVIVNGKPRITGYTIDGDFYPVDSDNPVVIYTGGPITFNIGSWDTYYSSHLDIWSGSIDDLTQTDAATYTVTLMLKNDEDGVRIWGYKDASQTQFDRSAVTLKFSIKYLMLDIPKMPENITYTGGDVNVIRYFLDDTQYSDLLEQYGAYLDASGKTLFKYVEITGEEGKTIGSYKLYMKIKPEYLFAVRWNDGTDEGLADTYTWNWNILPIYLVKPTVNKGVYITFDEKEHGVEEVLVGYSASGLSDDLAWFMQNANHSLEGIRSVNAGTFTAIFSLPNSNFAWMGADGKPDPSTDSIRIEWTINKCVIDLSTGVKWDYEKPFEYARKNGQPYAYKVSLVGLPDVLMNYVSYRTDGGAGNSASEVGTHTTSVMLSTGSLNSNNYTIGELPAELNELEWEIVERQFTLPQYDGSWDYFDGGVHDLMGLLGYGDDWDNYFDVEVTYDPKGGENFGVYDVSKDPNVGYSIYNGFYVGSYRIKITIKANINSDELNRIVWVDSDGNVVLDVQEQIITCEKLIVDVSGWNEDREYSTIEDKVLDDLIKDYRLPESIRDLFEYVIYDADDDNKTPLEVTDIEDGKTYRIEFRVKKGYESGIEITGTWWLEFGKYSFGNQPVIWLPIPVLEHPSLDYNGKEQTFVIDGWSSVYSISSEQRLQLRNIYGVTLKNTDTKFVYLLEGDDVLKQTAAGEYKAVLRFINGVNLSWYDPAIYDVDSSGNLILRSNGSIVTDTDKLIKRTSYTVKFEIKPVAVPEFDTDALTDMILEIVFNNKEQDITAYEKNAEIFKAIIEKYGSLITIEGNKYTNVDADGYELIIRLTDENSSYWETGEFDYSTVTAEGYEFRYVQVDGEWKLLLISTDGSNTEYDGNYTTDGVKYQYDYVLNYVAIGSGDNSLIDENGRPKHDADLYVLDGDGAAVRFVKNGNIYEVNPDGDYVAKYAIDGDRNKIVKNEYVVNYVLIGSGDDELLDGDGKPKADDDRPFILNPDDTAVRFTKKGDRFVEDANGEYIGYYELDENGDKKEQPVYAYDENGYRLIDNENSTVIIAEPVKGYDTYTYKWKITPKGLETPYIEGDSILYTGYLVKLAENEGLKGFDSEIMAFTQNGTATDVGTYTAIVKLTSDNYFWKANPALDYVTFVWSIEKGVLDLSKITWGYSWDIGDGTQFPVYTRENGEAIAYYVQLVGVPDAVKANVQYETNGKVGAYAGREAGKYVTSYKFVNIKEENFEQIIWPQNLESSVTWYISKRKLVAPELNQTWVKFNDSEYNLLEMLNLSDEINEYCDVKVEYASDFVNYVEITSLTEWYLVRDAGAYRFSIEIKDGINTNANNPSVVWLTGSTDNNDNLGTPESMKFSVVLKGEEATSPEATLPEENEDDELLNEDYTEPDTSLYDESESGEPETGEPETGEPEDGEDGEGEGNEGNEGGDGNEGEEGNEGEIKPVLPSKPDIGEGEIGKPDDDDRDDPDDWTTEIDKITMGVGKLIIDVTGWTGTRIEATLAIDYSQYIAEGNEALVMKILGTALKYEIIDTHGNVIAGTDVDVSEYNNLLKPGYTYFKRAVIIDRYAQNIELVYKGDAKKLLDVWMPFTNDGDYVKIDKPDNLTLEPKPYTGEDITFIIDFLIEYRAYLEIVEGESALTKRESGEYSVTICFKDGVYATWKTSSGAIDRSAIIIKFSIKAKEIRFDTTDLGEVVYTGSEIDITETLKKLYGEDILDYIIIAYGSDVKQTNAKDGNYEIVISLNSSYGGNIAWAEGTKLNADGTLTLTWRITQAVIDGEWNEYGRLDITSETYTGGTAGKIQYVYTDVETGEEVAAKFLVSGRRYTVRAILLDTVNLRWARDVGTYTFTQKEIVWLKAPVLTKTEASYTGLEITFEIDEWTKYSEYMELISGSLTQIKADTYKVVFRLKEGVFIYKDEDDEQGSTDDIEFTFTIKRAVLKGTWIDGAGILNLESSYMGSYETIVEYIYTTEDGTPVTELTKGETYIVTAVLKDEVNFVWEEEPKPFRFTYTANVVILSMPKILVTEYTYTGVAITFVIENWLEEYDAYLDPISGQLTQTEAGVYTVSYRIKSGVLAAWEEGVTETGVVTLTFEIKKVVLNGAWGKDGKVKFEANSYVGSYDDVVEYVYTNSAGVEVKASELKSGETYTARIRFKPGAENNFEFGENFETSFKFTYESNGGGFPWWAILLLVLALILIIIIIIVIIIVIKRRAQTQYEYKDEYYGGEDDYDNEDSEDGAGDGYDVEGDVEDFAATEDNGGDDDFSDIYGEDSGDAGETAEDDFSDIYGSDDGGDNGSF